MSISNRLRGYNHLVVGDLICHIESDFEAGLRSADPYKNAASREKQPAISRIAVRTQEPLIYQGLGHLTTGLELASAARFLPFAQYLP